MISRRLATRIAAALVVSAVLLGTGEARAQPLNADFKGMIGGGLIGAELGFVIPAAIGLTDAWAFIVFPLAGAGGGGAAGYYLLEQGGSAELAVATLTLGMALVIPTMVITLSATAYDPDEDEGGIEAPDGTIKGSIDLGRRRVVERALAAGPGLLKWSEQGLSLGAPVISAGPHMSRQEAFRLGVRPRTEYRLALVSGSF